MDQKRIIDLGVYLQEIESSLHPELKRTRHEMEIDCPPGLILDTYPGAIFQILANLVMNSLMHAFVDRPQGRIVISVRGEADEVSMTYRDDGSGMTEDVRRQIFDPFFTTRRGSGGSGLGLHIVWNLATQMLAGSIACESAPETGTRFKLRFPAVQR